MNVMHMCYVFHVCYGRMVYRLVVPVICAMYVMLA